MHTDSASQMPSRSASLSRTRLNSCGLNSPILRSRRATGAVWTCCKWYAPSRKNGLGIFNSQRLPRNEFVWNTTVTKSSSSSAGGPVRTRQGRIFPTYPASITQTSPGCGLGFGILGFPAVNFPACGHQKVVRQFHLFLLSRQLKNPAGDRPSFRLVEFRQLRNDFRCAHKRTITAGIGQCNHGVWEP